MATKQSQYDKLRNLYDEGLTQNATENSAQSLWNSLSYGYGKKAEDITRQYSNALAQQDQANLARGMQRSSYAAQTRANMYDQRNRALADNTDAMIADWQNRLTQQQEAEAARKFQAEEAEKQRGWQSGENALNRAFTTSEREAGQLYNTSERVATQNYQSGENALNRAFQTSERQAEQAWRSGESALDRAQSQAQFDANLNWQRERAAVSDEQWQKSFDAQREQWDKQFEYTKMSDEQKLNYNYVMYAMEKGNDVSDAMLEKAGLTRGDYNAMKTQVAPAVSGGGGRRTTKAVTDEGPAAAGMSASDFLNNLFGTNNTQQPATTPETPKTAKTTPSPAGNPVDLKRTLGVRVNMAKPTIK